MSKCVVWSYNSCKAEWARSEMDRLCKKFSNRTFKIVQLDRVERQPAKSPDCNILDLAIFNAMQAAVYAHNGRFPSVEVLDGIVMKVWKGFSEDQISKIFNTLDLVAQAIVEDKGGNRFLLPHGKGVKGLKAFQECVKNGVSVYLDKFDEFEPEAVESG